MQSGEWSVDDGGGEAAARYGYVAPDVWLEIAYHACGVVCQNARVYEPSAGVKHHEGEITVDIVLENSDYSPPCRYWRATANALRIGIGERQTERKRENCAAYPCHWQKVYTIAIAKAKGTIYLTSSPTPQCRLECLSVRGQYRPNRAPNPESAVGSRVRPARQSRDCLRGRPLHTPVLSAMVCSAYGVGTAHPCTGAYGVTRRIPAPPETFLSA